MFEKKDILIRDFGMNKLCSYTNNEIIDAIYEYTLVFIDKLKIYSLEKIYVKSIKLLDNELGCANSSNRNVTISFEMAVSITNSKYKNMRYNDKGVATLYHELSHIYDYENIIDKQTDIKWSEEVKKGFCVFTEFLAAYRSFELFEDKNIYSLLEKEIYNGDEKKLYYASLTSGYYCNKNHSNECDNLIDEYFDRETWETFCLYMKDMMVKYEDITEEHLIKCNELAGKCFKTKKKTGVYTPVDMRELLKKLNN